jgi:site-specific DNA-methyltransferase (adenine-specific)
MDLGLTEVPVIVLGHLTAEQRRAYVLADNQLALNAGWDMELLSTELQELQLADFDLSLIGFSDDELADLLPNVEELPPEDADADAVPEPPAEPVTKPGDVWLLGKHRVMCGDSTSLDELERLMGGAQADCVWTDPPYGVAYVGKTQDALTIQNDDLDDEALTIFLRESLGAAFALSKSGSSWYVAAPPGPLFHCFGTALKELEVWRHTLAWVKSTFVMGRCDYHYQHEAIFYGWKPGAAHKW